MESEEQRGWGEREALCEGLAPARGSGVSQRRCCLRSMGVLAAALVAACMLAASPAPQRPRAQAVSDASSSGAAPQIDVWYVNVKGMTDRDRCVRGQFERVGTEPRRYEADVFSHCGDGSSHAFVECLEQQGFGDCVRGGIDWVAVRRHNFSNNASTEVVEHIVSNWCSHKRLFSKLAGDAGAGEFVLVCEDDLFINHTRLMPELQSFARSQSGWDLLVVDPLLEQRKKPWRFCEDCEEYVVGRHNGATIWSLSQVESKDAVSEGGCLQGDKCNLCGAQAWLVRRSAMGRLVSTMESIPTVPLDWLPRQLPGALAWKPNVANNPINLNVTWPASCTSKVAESSIEGRDTSK